MGTVSSMCCEGDDAAKARHTPIPTNKPDRSKPKETNESRQVLPAALRDQQNKVKAEQTAKEQARKENEVLQLIQERYAPPTDKKSVKWESFEVSHKIGGGGFGEVFLAELKQNKEKGIVEKYAIKRVLKSQIIKKNLTTNLKLEKRILQTSRSPFITSLFYAFRDEKYLYFVMEWAQGGDTYSFICQGSKRVEDFKAAGQKAVRFILGCLIMGMEELHRCSIMYRDLKPQNVLIFENGYVKLTDFGLAKEIKEDELSKTEAGTNIYYAPEMVLKEGYGKEIDLWTIGIYAYEMSNFSPPFSGQQIKDRLKVKKLVKTAEQGRYWKNPNLSVELKSFIDALLKFDPKERLGYKGWKDIKEHAFFTSAKFDWKALEEMRLQSPIKPIIDKFKLRYKPYNPQELTKKGTSDSTVGGKELQGWTYVRDQE